MPIVNTGMKKDAWLQMISRRLEPGAEGRYGMDDKHLWAEIYFGSGYWRGFFCEDEHGLPNERKVRLTNPDNTNAEARIVEQALCILHCGKYEAT